MCGESQGDIHQTSLKVCPRKYANEAIHYRLCYYRTMHKKSDTQRLIVIAIGISAFVLFLTTQGNPSFLFLFPIILLTLIISWYLHKEIQKDHEENLKRGVRYMKEEQEAQQWLQASFVPNVQRLAKKEMRALIIASGLVLMSFIFLWSFFVSGLLAAVLNTIIGLLFFVAFLIYALYAPKEFTHVFKRVPKRFKHHSKNNWVYGYILLFPFATLGFFLYSLTTTGEGIARSLLDTVFFLFSYTLLFICVYCLWYLYEENQKETEQSLKKTARKILKES